MTIDLDALEALEKKATPGPCVMVPVRLLKDWHDTLGNMVDQVGHPDYSLRELVNGMRLVRDELLAAAKEEHDAHR